MAPSAQTQALHEWCDTTEPQCFPAGERREWNIIDPDRRDVLPLYPIGERTMIARRGLVRLLLLTERSPRSLFTPEAATYDYAGLFYITADNLLQERARMREHARTGMSLRQEGEEEYCVPELQAWDRYLEESGRQDANEGSSFDLSGGKLGASQNIFWLAGRPVDLEREMEGGRREHFYNTQRNQILSAPRLNNHIEPLIFRSATPQRIFTLLSNKPISYPSMF